MTTPHQDLTFQPGCWVFGFTLPGHGHFGSVRTYLQQAIFGTRRFGDEIPGVNTENEILGFVFGAPVPRATGPWPRTPLMSCRARGGWAKRVIHSVYHGHPKARRFTPYEASAKESLVPSMLRLMAAAALWHTLTDEAKARLTVDARQRKGACQAYNYFCKLYIKNDPRYLDYV